MKIIGPTAHSAFFIKCGKLLQEETAERSVFLRVEHLMLVLNAVTNFGEIRPLILEAPSPTLGVLFKAALTYFWVIGEI